MLDDVLEAASNKIALLLEIGCAHAKNENRGAAQDAFRDAAQLAATLRDSNPKAVVFRQIAAAQAKSGDVEGASHVFAKSLEAAGAIEIGGGTDVLAIVDIAVAQAEFYGTETTRETFQRALSAAFAYPDEAYVGRLLQGAAEQQARSGDASGAAAWAIELEAPVMKAQALVGILRGRSGQPEDMN